MIKKILLKKSAVEDKMPSPEQLEYGEIALNFNTMNPFISFKDTADGIRQIKDYSNEIHIINGYLTDAKNEINYLRPLVTDNNTKLMFLRSDFEDFKTDNTKTINALRTDIDKNTDAIATKADKTELDSYATKEYVQTNAPNETKESIEEKLGAWFEEEDGDVDGEVYTKAESDARYYEKQATDTLLDEKVDKTDIVQSTGTSETSVMSQKAVSDIIGNVEQLLNSI